jgi:hypothetical protein
LIMAVIAEVETLFGDACACYVRLNHVVAGNHGTPAKALFRGFMSKQAFDAGKHYVFEREIEFVADVTRPLWEQAYEALRSLPVEAIPDEPAAPQAPTAPEGAADGSPAMLEYLNKVQEHQQAVAQHAADADQWRADCAAIEARNCEVMALAMSEDA